MVQINAQTRVGQLAAEYPRTRRTFRRYGIPYACRRELLLGRAAQEVHVPADVLVRDLRTAIMADPGGDRLARWYGATVGELVDHIQTSYHLFPKLWVALESERTD